MDTIARLRAAATAIVAVLAFGTLGYVLFGWPVLDALY
ncbi:MAG: potassium channel protein, partial [Planctomycetota bacterium]